MESKLIIGDLLQLSVETVKFMIWLTIYDILSCLLQPRTTLHRTGKNLPHPSGTGAHPRTYKRLSCSWIEFGSTLSVKNLAPGGLVQTPLECVIWELTLPEEKKVKMSQFEMIENGWKRHFKTNLVDRATWQSCITYAPRGHFNILPQLSKPRSGPTMRLPAPREAGRALGPGGGSANESIENYS